MPDFITDHGPACECDACVVRGTPLPPPGVISAAHMVQVAVRQLNAALVHAATLGLAVDLSAHTIRAVTSLPFTKFVATVSWPIPPHGGA